MSEHELAGREQGSPWDRMQGALRRGVAGIVLAGAAIAPHAAEAQQGTYNYRADRAYNDAFGNGQGQFRPTQRQPDLAICDFRDPHPRGCSGTQFTWLQADADGVRNLAAATHELTERTRDSVLRGGLTANQLGTMMGAGHEFARRVSGEVNGFLAGNPIQATNARAGRDPIACQIPNYGNLPQYDGANARDPAAVLQRLADAADNVTNLSRCLDSASGFYRQHDLGIHKGKFNLDIPFGTGIGQAQGPGLTTAFAYNARNAMENIKGDLDSFSNAVNLNSGLPPQPLRAPQTQQEMAQQAYAQQRAYSQQQPGYGQPQGLPQQPSGYGQQPANQAGPASSGPAGTGQAVSPAIQAQATARASQVWAALRGGNPQHPPEVSDSARGTPASEARMNAGYKRVTDDMTVLVQRPPSSPDPVKSIAMDKLAGFAAAYIDTVLTRQDPVIGAHAKPGSPTASGWEALGGALTGAAQLQAKLGAKEGDGVKLNIVNTLIDFTKGLRQIAPEAFTTQRPAPGAPGASLQDIAPRASAPVAGFGI